MLDPITGQPDTAATDASPSTIQVLMPEILRADFTVWLTSRGLELQRTPFLDDPAEDGEPVLPVYNVAPTPATFRRASR